MSIVSIYADGRTIKSPCNVSAGNLPKAARVQKQIDQLIAAGAHKRAEGWDLRSKLVSSVCWFLMTSEQLDILAGLLRGKRVLEIAAGTGYLAAQMRLRGVTDYRALDARCSYFNMKSINFGTEIADFYELSDEEFRTYDIVIMTWPPYDSQLAYHVFRKMRNGQVVLYQGEFWGCTGDDKFHYALDSHCQEQTEIKTALDNTPRWYGLRDRWYAFKKFRNYARRRTNSTEDKIDEN